VWRRLLGVLILVFGMGVGGPLRRKEVGRKGAS
jgi:hypothetical protein